MSSLDGDSRGQEIHEILCKSCRLRVLQNQLELAGSTCQVSEIELQTVSENTEWVAEGFFLGFRPQYRKLPKNSYPNANFRVLESCVLSWTSRLVFWRRRPDLANIKMCAVFTLVRMTSGGCSWPQERLLLKFSIALFASYIRTFTKVLGPRISPG